MMQSPSRPVGFRVLDTVENSRKPIDWRQAFFAYLEADERAECHRVAFLSLFHYGREFVEHVGRCGTVRGFTGPVGADWLAFDIDSPDLEAARLQACKLVAFILERFGLGEDDALYFPSGAKGFHIVLPAELVGSPAPCADFAAVAGEFCGRVAAGAGVAVDGIYDSMRLFRAPNSKHGKTGLHKVPLTWRELSSMSAARIQELAQEPRCRELKEAPPPCPVAVGDWQAAEAAVRNRTARPPQAVERKPELNATTWGVLSDGIIEQGGGGAVGLDGKPAAGRHKTLFAVAADLGGLGCSPELAAALLLDIGLRSGLPRGDVERAIGNGLAAGKGGSR
jgi:hypothetical protein